jgi:hypothetical protein
MKRTETYLLVDRSRTCRFAPDGNMTRITTELYGRLASGPARPLEGWNLPWQCSPEPIVALLADQLVNTVSNDIETLAVRLTKTCVQNTALCNLISCQESEVAKSVIDRDEDIVSARLRKERCGWKTVSVKIMIAITSVLTIVRVSTSLTVSTTVDIYPNRQRPFPYRSVRRNEDIDEETILGRGRE